VFTYADGNKYEGGWENGKQHGKGVFTFADGNKYEGGWENGKQHGKVVLTFADGNKYEGGFEKGKQHGKGVFTWASGDKYEGGFENDVRHGKGVFTYADGNKYEGDHENGMRHGKGVFTDANGTMYEGEFVNSKKRGAFEVRYSDGRTEQKHYSETRSAPSSSSNSLLKQGKWVYFCENTSALRAGAEKDTPQVGDVQENWLVAVVEKKKTEAGQTRLRIVAATHADTAVQAPMPPGGGWCSEVAGNGTVLFELVDIGGAGATKKMEDSELAPVGAAKNRDSMGGGTLAETRAEVRRREIERAKAE
jgi:hypothetical protein